MIRIGDMPEDLTPEQYQKVAPEIIKYLLSAPEIYADGVDEILDWEIDKDMVARGRFVDRRPAGDRIFSFELDLRAKTVNIRALEGVD